MDTDQDAQLEAVLIGGREKWPIVIVDYDSGWAQPYGALAERIAEALGKTALHIEYIGSTAVPKLPAKPIIDILLIVNDADDEGSYLPALESAGFTLRKIGRAHV